MKKMSLLSKPQPFKKMLTYKRMAEQGEYALQLLELNYNNSCNFSCQHCFSANLSREGRKITVEDVRHLSKQADELGVWQWHLQGGEPLTWDDLDEVIDAINPQKYYIFLTTNGFLLTPQKAEHLARIGVDKVSVSLDSFDAKSHDTLRNKPGSHKKALEALFNARNAGLQANINTVITKQNVRTQEILDIINFAETNDFTILFVIATSVGNWAGKTDMLIDEEDAKYLKDLKKQHPIIHRDLYPLFDFEWGCRTMNGLVYITENGDLLSCPFIHIKIGNIFEEPLKDILARGWRVKYFRDISDKCLAGEDRYFIKNYMAKTIGVKSPIPFSEAFTDKDLYDIQD